MPTWLLAHTHPWLGAFADYVSLCPTLQHYFDSANDDELAKMSIAWNECKPTFTPAQLEQVMAECDTIDAICHAIRGE
jgi:hypothetical protein